MSPLSALTSLEWLNLGKNEIVDVSPLSALTSLEGLILRSNEIEDVSPLSALTSLKELNLRSNEIVDVSPLGGLTSLKWLSLEKNQIQDISPLVANTGLGEGDAVLLYFNPLSDQAINEQIPDSCKPEASRSATDRTSAVPSCERSPQCTFDSSSSPPCC